MRLPRCAAAALLVFLVGLPRPAWAVKEWYDHYADAEADMEAERWKEALASLDAAIALKPNSGLNERTYGMSFEVYLPYFRKGVCQFYLDDFSEAIRLFNFEERQGAIKRDSSSYAELRRLRAEAEDSLRQRVARLLRSEVQTMIGQATEHRRAGRFDEALARLAEAQKAAESLDAGVQQRIADLKDAIRADAQARAEAEARARRIEQGLAEGQRLLAADQPTEAIVQLDEVLALDSGNATARQAKAQAQETLRATRTRQALEARFQQGKALFEAGRYEEAIPALTEAVTGTRADEARALLDEARATVERVREQQRLRVEIETLLGEGEALLQAHSFAQAQVRFESVLALDPGSVRAKERLAFAERRIGEQILDRWFPPQPPVLNVLEPRSVETTVEGPTVAVVGSATDDRSIDRIEVRLGDRVVAQLTPVPWRDGGQSLRNVRFDRVLPLEEGLNRITVTAWDGSGQKVEDTFSVTRHLRFYETRAFLPSALGAAVALFGLGLGFQRARRARAVRGRFNPYIAGAPVVDDDMFFGRERLMARLLNVLHHNSLMITGERRIGKTTFLLHLRKVLARDDITDYRFFPVFVDLQGVPEASFFHSLMADVVDALELSPATLAALRFRPQPREFEGRDFSHDLQLVIGELATRTNKRVKLALLIDEVDVLNEYSSRVNQRLRSIFMKTFSEHLVAIMSGVGIKRIWESEGSPWYNFFDEVELTPFTREEAEALIREPVAGVFRFTSGAVERILAESELKPYVIQKFCIHAVNRMLEERRTTVTEADVDAVRGTVKLDRGEPEAEAGDARQVSA